MKPANILKKPSGGRIIAPVDGSETAKRAAEEAIRLAKQTNRSVYALYVIDTPRLTNVIPPNEISTLWTDGLNQQGEQILADVREMGRKNGVKVETKIIVGFPEEEILKAAKKDDLIVMGCKGKTALDRILLGSVCENVIHHSKGPVMVIH